jgi:hypothetical protein
MEQKQKSRSNKSLIVALLASFAFNIYQWSDSNKMEDIYNVRVDSLITSRVDVEKILTDTYTELNQYKSINLQLDSLLTEANNKIDRQKEKINHLIEQSGTQGELTDDLQEELNKLKMLKNDYIEKIDLLLVENEQLKKDKNDLTGTVAILMKNLEETVTTASVLKSEYFRTTAYKKRPGEKYAVTMMSRRTNKLETCFTLLENAIAKPGKKTVYMRIVEPGGKILGNRSEGSSTFRKSGDNEDLLFTSSKEIDYNNQRINMCLDWEEKDNSFVNGIYLLEVYVDGTLSGAGSIALR